MNDLVGWREKLNNHIARYRLAKDKYKEEKKILAETKTTLEHLGEAQRIVQHIAQTIQQAAHDRIARIVSRCLEAVFEEPYEFHINFERKRGKTEAELTFLRNGEKIDPLTASGGGVVDVASFALRLACLVLTQPQKRRLLVLDEPLKHLSQNHAGRVREMLMELSMDLKVQFIMVTHQPKLQVGKVIEL